ncbi:MAG: DUF2520 domain-containing protein, partial [Clostridia bacterium]|nr:DUF2520 domain-containing protein [Clostridia bacterium]
VAPTGKKPKVGIIGAGRVGGAVGLLLREKGYPLCGVKNSSAASTARAAKLLGTRAFDRATELAHEAEVLFLTVRDELIGPLAARLAAQGAFRPGQVVIHASGSQPASVLAPARASGAYILSLHPLQSCPTPEKGRENLPGAVFSIEGDEAAFPLAEQLVQDLGGTFFYIDPAAKPLYHAAACVASNYLVTLLDLARALLVEAGLPPELMVKALYPLIYGTLANVAAVGIPQALTGPISRGDAVTVAGHVAALAAQKPELLDLYCLLGQHTVTLAEQKGTVDAIRARQLRLVLGGDGKGAQDQRPERNAAVQP